MSAVTASIEIAAPLDTVWDIVMDATRLGEWVTIHRGLESHDEQHMEQILHLRGLNFHVNWELTSSDRPRHAHWKGRGPARSTAETEYRLSETGAGTRFDYRTEFKVPFGPVGAVAGRALVGGVSQREANASLGRLKALCEA